VGPELRYIFWPPKEARKCSAAQGPHSEVVPRAFWRLVSKSCDECKGSFARGCEAKRWSHWTCSSLGTIFQPMRINSVPDVKCFCNNKTVLCLQSMVWHFVRHSVYSQFIQVDISRGVTVRTATGWNPRNCDAIPRREWKILSPSKRPDQLCDP